MAWTLLFADEFDKPKDSSADPANWYVTDEQDYDEATLDHFTSRPKNVCHDGQSNLLLRAYKEPHQGFSWTSGQIRSVRRPDQNKFSVGGQSWAVEWRMKFTNAPRVWPSLWGMGDQWVPGAWPQEREWDDMESGYYAQGIITGTCISPGFNGFPMGQRQTTPNQFHIYRCESYREERLVNGVAVDVQVLRWLHDGVEFHRRTSLDIPDWGFERKRSLIADLSIYNDVDASLTYAEMVIDYVRVYVQDGAVPPPPPPPPTGGTMTLTPTLTGRRLTFAVSPDVQVQSGSGKQHLHITTAQWGTHHIYNTGPYDLPANATSVTVELVGNGVAATDPHPLLNNQRYVLTVGGTTPPPPPPPSTDPKQTVRPKLKALGLTDAEVEIVVNP